MAEKIEYFESASRFFSAGFVLRLTYVILFIFFALDIVGLLLAYAHAPVRAAESAALFVAGLFIAYDQIGSGTRLAKVMSRAFLFEKPTHVLARYLHMMRPKKKWTHYAASYGKFIATLYFALWAFAE